MNQWLLIRRLRGPAFLLLIGIMALLHEWTYFGFGRSWPLLLILAGIFALAERAALSQASMDGYDPITGHPYQQPQSTTAYGAGSSIVPAPPSTGPGPDAGMGRP
jgi:hypothetical protein